MSKINTVILNAPPKSGKDSLADYIHIDFNRLQFKESLFIETAKYYDVSLDWFMENYNHNKEEKQSKLHGLSKREALINVSENHVKVNYGKDYFGVQAASRLVSDKVNVFTDGGFIEELVPIIEKSDNVLVIELRRPNYTFDNDSRNYLFEKVYDEGIHDKVDFVMVGNNTNLFDCQSKIIHCINSFVKGDVFTKSLEINTKEYFHRLYEFMIRIGNCRNIIELIDLLDFYDNGGFGVSYIENGQNFSIGYSEIVDKVISTILTKGADTPFNGEDTTNLLGINSIVKSLEFKDYLVKRSTY